MLSKLLCSRRRASPESASQIDSIIPPEIKDDAFYATILDLASTIDARNILEIGSSSGRGSTEAFALGILRNPVKPLLHCLEISKVRFGALKEHYAGHPQVRVYNASSVPAVELPTAEQVSAFHSEHLTKVSAYPLDQVLSWLEADRECMGQSPIQDGIRHVMAEAAVDTFDIVLIDGSEFTGEPELGRVYGARWLLLDDVNAHKNFRNYHRLRQDPSYRLVREDWDVRHGYAVFQQVPAAPAGATRLEGSGESGDRIG